MTAVFVSAGLSAADASTRPLTVPASKS